MLFKQYESRINAAWSPSDMRYSIHESKHCHQAYPTWNLKLKQFCIAISSQEQTKISVTTQILNRMLFQDKIEIQNYLVCMKAICRCSGILISGCIKNSICCLQVLFQRSIFFAQSGNLILSNERGKMLLKLITY